VLISISAMGQTDSPVEGNANAGTTRGKKGPPAVVRNVGVLREKKGLSVAITSNGSLIPTITRLDGPPRLVIDLLGAASAVPPKRIPVGTAGVKAVRINQYQQSPPLTRVVVDLTAPTDYLWETTEHELIVHLRPMDETAEKSNVPEPSVSAPAYTQGAQAVVSGAVQPGAVVLAGDKRAGGSSVTAGSDTTVLNLARGGQVLVCPGTTISVTPSKSGQELMLGMSTGALETHYTLPAYADSILTPDFRIQLPGPGEFHYAISADAKGDTCVRALPGNNASAVVSELMGGGTYQVKPGEQVVFHAGQLAKADNAVPADCGCPNPQTQVLRAEAEPPQPPFQNPTTSNRPTASDPQPSEETKAVAPELPSAKVNVTVEAPGTAPPPASQPNDVHVQVEAPLVYRASNPAPVSAQEAERLPAVSDSRNASLTTVAQPSTPTPPGPNKPQPKAHRGFFGRIRGFFHAIFG
jgi:hypothetical protein